ncbi:putative cell wall hydrolase [Thermoclostridium stercorarium subsp. stercorarium DSM 8532]|jgi:N-acetylmuramoyl-L-alanine amidase|uniref:Peptidoglycan-binding protein n=2 Tax=Thermoclostridium stercorarium TaxID=1510 RepID=A0A1B1YK17_THEST|nr:LysM peptidoglycan-binding domain-containing protein [Thermoclostridium stercorarium]AGC68165.1 putative cell wall hydrolase [Thermoclostridium stercorarium subsp. stercorarium DSM 8532]AGI39192.1 LysM domain-containing protein [Thermoclostridium stercorarium subsp. stercorarium DSM 8532]ANX01072.1 peptidoglycan-binding protein [Thermoclostridium stercorarium subsp. leptospartum DSM 9219]UZQ86690.1 LysM peptidoglycan-binding domain-containing protein [Thermoclostridium stercorarium]
MNKKAKVFFAVLVLSSLVPTFANAATYTVVKGDSLYTLGQLFGTTSGTLMTRNGLKSTVIYPGQKLEVPATVYTVQKGDSLYLIAKKYGITLSALRKANGKWDDMIYVGQKLIIPGSASVTANSAASANNSAISYTQSDLDLLARLITAEANNQPYTAKVAVGAVVINRVKDSRFPNTIRGVIYEKSYGYYQFTPVQNGMINKPASQEALKAAYDALNGVDPTNGALYFFDKTATNKWLWSKPIALRAGDMIYAY